MRDMMSDPKSTWGLVAAPVAMSRAVPQITHVGRYRRGADIEGQAEIPRIPSGQDPDDLLPRPDEDGHLSFEVSPRPPEVLKDRHVDGEVARGRGAAP